MSAQRSGWCAGDIIASESDPGRGDWLTVWGSYYTAPELHATRGQAQDSGQRGDSVAHVTEVDYPGVGRAYRITAGTLIERDPVHRNQASEPPDDCAICVPGQCPGPDCPGNYGSEAGSRTTYRTTLDTV